MSRASPKPYTPSVTYNSRDLRLLLGTSRHPWRCGDPAEIHYTTEVAHKSSCHRQMGTQW